MTGDQDQSELIRGSAVSFLMKGAGLFIAYLFAFTVARLLGAEAWGEFSLALSLIALCAILSVTGFDTLLLKFSSSVQHDKKLGTIYRQSLAVTVLISLAMTLASYTSANWLATVIFNNPSLTGTFRIASFAVLPYSLINLNSGLLQGLKKINSFVFIRFVSHHLGALLIILIFFYSWKPDHIVIISYTIALYLIALISFLFLRKEILNTSISCKKIYTTHKITSLLRISAPFLFIAALLFMKGWIDTIMIGVFMSEKDVGIYNIALKLSGLLFLIMTSVSVIATPLFSESFSAKYFKELKKKVTLSSSIMFYSTLPIFFILVVFPEQILSIFGDDFRAAKISLIILSIGCFYHVICGATGYFMQMTGSQIVYRNILLMTAIIGILLNLLLIPKYGIEGAATATCISMIFLSSSGVYHIKKKFNIKTYFRFK